MASINVKASQGDGGSGAKIGLIVRASESLLFRLNANLRLASMCSFEQQTACNQFWPSSTFHLSSVSPSAVPAIGPCRVGFGAAVW
jgi:hypothetical protein